MLNKIESRHFHAFISIERNEPTTTFYQVVQKFKVDTFDMCIEKAFHITKLAIFIEINA